MCDAKRNPACENVFSELTDDWSTMTGSQYTTNPITGKRERREVEMDVCGTCNRGDAPGVSERTAIQATLNDTGPNL
jgi:hypothetical protein